MLLVMKSWRTTARAAEVEIEEFDQVVTDWEIARGFERA